jgi:hypothetical protein
MLGVLRDGGMRMLGLLDLVGKILLRLSWMQLWYFTCHFLQPQVEQRAAIQVLPAKTRHKLRERKRLPLGMGHTMRSAKTYKASLWAQE